jgi:hypothetical protein
MSKSRGRVRHRQYRKMSTRQVAGLYFHEVRHWTDEDAETLLSMLLNSPKFSVNSCVVSRATRNPKLLRSSP